MTGESWLEAYRFHERDWDDYASLREAFEWEVPETFNVATYTCDRWADGARRVALYATDADGTTRQYTFDRIQTVTNRLANFLAASGVERGDRVGVNLPQCPEALFTQLAVWKLGAVSVPLSTLFGPDALRYRLDDCDATACVVHASNVDAYRDARANADADLETVVVGDVAPGDEEAGFWTAIEPHSGEFDTVPTRAEDVAVITYTSGTTGDPKGVVHAHRVLLSQLPLFLCTYCDLELSDDDVFWTPAEWSWFGPMFSMVLPALFHRKSLVAYTADGPFDPETAFEILETYDVTVPLLPPTALRKMMQVESPAERYELDDVRVVMSGGEDVGPSLTDWVDDVFEGAPIQEALGQTEANSLTGTCNSLFDAPDGTSGRPFPGHEVAIVDPETAEPIDEPDVVGEVAIRYEGNPVCMKEYWNRPEQTDEKIQNGWLLSEDLGSMDADGNLTYHSRKDDVIISSGRRLGPGEIEDSLTGHDAVLEAGVIGVPDKERGEIPKAFVALAAGEPPSDELRTRLQEYVQDRLARYEYPHEIEFVDDLPTTTTGKVQRAELRDLEESIE